MQDDFLGHPNLGPSWKIVLKDGKRSAKLFENLILTLMHLDQVYSLFKPINYMRTSLREGLF